MDARGSCSLATPHPPKIRRWVSVTNASLHAHAINYSVLPITMLCSLLNNQCNVKKIDAFIFIKKLSLSTQVYPR